MNTYALLDFGGGKRLEQWGDYRLIRPDPTAIDWPKDEDLWKRVDAIYEGEKGKGAWKKNTDVPDHWEVDFDDLKLFARLAPYKHTGIFPEQSENWRWMRKTAKRPVSILNLFAYTGGASIALAKDGHRVTHVDSARPSIGWAKENAALNDLPDNAIRWILEDAPKFADREKKRGNRYDGIVLDPPAFGHSPSGKTWRVERDLKPLLETCVDLLSDDPSFVVLNGYATHDAAHSFRTLLSGMFKTRRPDLHAMIAAEELLLHTTDGRSLSTGIVARVSFEKET